LGELGFFVLEMFNNADWHPAYASRPQGARVPTRKHPNIHQLQVEL
jgi:hypothetical protein